MKNETGTFTDSRDSKIYETVKIIDQIWMAQNFAFKPDSGEYWAYNDNEEKIDLYGYLYDWETAKEICPAGWHLPSDEEWKTLEMNLGMSQSDANNVEWRGTAEDILLKSTSGWDMGRNGNNITGFSILPGGCRQYNGRFLGIGYSAYFWCSSEIDYSEAWYRFFAYDWDGICRKTKGKSYGFSVRYIRD